jgi:hypothetical protein
VDQALTEAKTHINEAENDDGVDNVVAFLSLAKSSIACLASDFLTTVG